MKVKYVIGNKNETAYRGGDYFDAKYNSWDRMYAWRDQSRINNAIAVGDMLLFYKNERKQNKGDLWMIQYIINEHDDLWWFMTVDNDGSIGKHCMHYTRSM